jgi:hypothetical protein
MPFRNLVIRNSVEDIREAFASGIRAKHIRPSDIREAFAKHPPTRTTLAKTILSIEKKETLNILPVPAKFETSMYWGLLAVS